MIYNESKYNKGWNLKALNQLGDFRRGKSKHRPRNDKQLFENGIYPLVQTGEISAANLYVKSHSATYNEFGLKQSKLWQKNTLCITIAANIAETALLGYPMCFPDSIVGFIANPNESSELFMHYVFTYIKKSIQNSASGSIQDNINIDYLTSLQFRIPEKTYQDKIVGILSTLDSKIALNNLINTELEEMAKTLYDYWFVQFDFPVPSTGSGGGSKPYKSSGGKMVWNEELKREVPEGWKNGELKDVVEIKYGKDHKKIDLGNIPIYGSGGIMRYGNQAIYEKESILIPRKGSLSNLFYINKPFWSVDTMFYTKMNIENIGRYLFYYLHTQKISSLNVGTAVPSLTSEVLNQIKILIPSEDILKNYNQTTTSFFEMRDVNIIQNTQLSSLRDWLLPMLMNGQVKVGDASAM